ncbi:MAG: molybdopterin-dependent oxidoreductase [Dehalococcoidia bacterium]|nr:hypothetical protein [Chloroflexota bacterium]MBT9161517.1 hypothetical protein [Chloroflexota bacterium]
MSKGTMMGLLMCILLLGSMLAGCPAPQVDVEDDPVAEPVWSIAIEGVEGVEEFTDIDAAKLAMITVDVVQRRRDGTETPQSWEGIPLRNVMDHLGVIEFSSIVVIAGDDYTMEYTPDIVNADDSILGLLLDGEALDEKRAPAQTIIGGKPARYWVRNVVRITVNK